MNLWLAAAVARAASVTVSPGDDLNTLTASLQPGDVVTFNKGTYPLQGTVYWTGLGTADQPIELRSTNGEVVLQNDGTYGGYVADISASAFVSVRGITFRGPEFSGTYTTGYGGLEGGNDASGIRIADSNNVLLENCTFETLGGTAIRLENNNEKVTVRHNQVSNTFDGSGVYVGCNDPSCVTQDSLIEYNQIHDVGGGGIILSNGTQNTVVQHNVIFRAAETGIVLSGTAFGPQNIASGNAIWGIDEDGIYIEGPALVQNNLVFQIHGYGIWARYDDYNDDGDLEDVQISHNTVAMTDDYAARLEGWFERPNMVFANNALANPIGYGLRWDDYNFDPYDNDDDTYTGAYETTNYISHNVVTGLIEGFDPVAHPTFVLPGGGITDFEAYENLDFYPTGDSMLRDQGDPAGEAYLPERDFNGTQRDGASPDAGAYEYDGEGNPGWVVQEGFKVYEELEGRNLTAGGAGCCGSGDATTAFVPAPFLLLLVLRRRRW